MPTPSQLPVPTQPHPDAIESVLSPTRSCYSAYDAGGVFSNRLSRAGTPLSAHFPRTPLSARFPQQEHFPQGEENEDVEDLKKEGDIKKKQEFKGWLLLYLAYQSTGVIYGDIGTSPLYVFSSTFSSEPSYDDLLGALSLIIYSLIIMVTIKYVCIVLSADDEGEGGTFALFSLLARYVSQSLHIFGWRY